MHGLLDRIMQVLEVPFLGSEKGVGSGYYIKESEGEFDAPIAPAELQRQVADVLLRSIDATYFPGRAATIHYRPASPIPADSVTNDTLHSDAVSDEAPAPEKSTLSPLHTIASALKSALPSSSKAAAPKDILLGSLGILHPSVLERFSIAHPCSALEIDVEAFL